MYCTVVGPQEVFNQLLPARSIPLNYRHIHTAILSIAMPPPTTRGKYCRYNSSYPFLPTVAVYILRASCSLVVISIVSYLLFHLRSRHLFFHLVRRKHIIPPTCWMINSAINIALSSLLLRRFAATLYVHHFLLLFHSCNCAPRH